MSNPIAPKFRTEWFAIALLVMVFTLGLYFYQNFPVKVPTHWNFAGEADSYSGRALTAWLMPCLMLAIYVMFLVLPYFDPKKEQYQKFANTYHRLKDLMIVFLFVLYFIIGLSGLGYPIDISFYVPLLIGGLFIIIGFFLKKIKMNWFIGIRTPWTLSSNKVWEKTNKLGTPVFIWSGLLIAITAFLPSIGKIILFITALALIILGLPAYSYWLYNNEKKNKSL